MAPTADDPRAPDRAYTHFYGTVLHDENRFRMWYTASHHLPSEEELKLYHDVGPAHICYAESDDGIHWNKPKLGQVMFEGSRENNALAIPDSHTEGTTLIKDLEEPDPKRRYKLAYQRYWKETNWTLQTAVSPDGINDWQVVKEMPIKAFLEFASMYQHHGMYFLNAQTISTFSFGEGCSFIGRQGLAWLSPDFDNWLQESAESFFQPEPADPAERYRTHVYDQVHLGVGAVSLGNVLVGHYCRWHENNPAEGFPYADVYGDLGLVVSNDGLHFREPVKGHVWLSSKDSRASVPEGEIYPTILVQGNSILNVGEETRIYHGRWLNRPKGNVDYAEVALATIPRDRWGALGLYSEAAEGSVWSAPITMPKKCQLILNADAAQNIKVEVADERFDLYPSHSGENSGAAKVSPGLEATVSWPKTGLNAFAGKIIRLKINLHRNDDVEPRLYAVYIRA